MGACDFYSYSEDPDSDAAFDKAVETAAWEHGHGGYTGTIAEKDSYITIQPKPISWEAAHQMAEELLTECDPRIDDKWGPAGAIAVGDDGKPRGWLFFGWASS